MPYHEVSERFGASPLELLPLPFDESALEPAISARTIGFHHGKHHKGYVDTLVKLVADTEFAGATLETIIFASHGDATKAAIFNNAAQCWNHNFYWNSLSPHAQTPSGALAAAVIRDFGSVEALQTALVDASVKRFGTGWGWLVSDAGTLKVLSTDDAELPITSGTMPLLTVDVWEHAYYLDYQNRRPDHVAAVVNHHLNWSFAEAQFARG
jgi:Fe-Mn family superoxide dismutase